MVCRHAGVIRAIPGDEKIRKLESFRSINWEAKVGELVNRQQRMSFMVVKTKKRSKERAPPPRSLEKISLMKMK